MQAEKGLLYSVIKRKNLVFVVVAFIFVFGFTCYVSSPKQEYPPTPMPFAIIVTAYPGASAEDVEELITKKIEDLAMTADSLKYVTSESSNGLSVVQVTFKETTDLKLLEKNQNNLRYELETLKTTELPAGVFCQLITEIGNADGMLLAFTGETQSIAELTQRAETLKSKIRGMSGVKAITISGDLQEEILVSVDVAKLNRTGLSLSDIGGIIQYQNSMIPAGNIEFDDDTIKVNTSGKFGSVKEIEDIIIGISDNSGAITKLKDIAVIEKAANSSAKQYQYNGKDAIILSLSYQDGINVVTAGAKILAAVDEYRQTLPKGIEINTVVDLASDVDKSISNFTNSVLQAVLIVLVVIMLGMSIRNGGIIAFVIPVSLLSVFIVMKLFGIYVQFISLAALIIALGMLVDNAVVVSDTIQVLIDEGMDKLEACVKGVRSVAFPVLASTMTTVSMFTIFYFLPGATKDFVSSLPTIVISALMASYVVSIFLTPIMCYLFMKKSKPPKMGKTNLVGRLGEVVDKLFQLAFKYKLAAILAAGTILVVSFQLLGTLDSELMPKSTKTLIDIKITSPNIEDMKKSKEATFKVAEIVRAQPETVYYMTAIKGGLPRYDFSAIPQEDAINKGNVVIGVDLKAGGRFKNNGEFVDFLQAEIDRLVPSCFIKVNELGIAPASEQPIQLRLIGDDFDALNSASGIIEDELSKIEGATTIRGDRQMQTLQYYLDIDDFSLNTYGITKAGFQAELNAALMGNSVSVFRKDGKEYPIVVKSGIHSSEELQNLMIKSEATGNKYQVKQLADIGLKGSYNVITRYNGVRTVLIGASPKVGYTPIAIQRQLEEALKSKVFENVTLKYEGDAADMDEALGILLTGVIVGVMGIILVLYLQFNSFRKLFYVLCAIPFSFVGSTLGLLAFRQSLSLFAVLGMLSLFGVVVNNAIVLVDFINKERERGVSIDEACQLAVKRRFRPVFLSTMTAVLGMLPLAISGNPLFTGMAIAFMCGDALCMFFTLIIVPVVYSSGEGSVEKRKMKKQGLSIRTSE